MQTLRLAARGLRRSPLFTTVAIAILALGIGGIAAGWSVVDAFLLAPLPYPQADRLVHLYRTDPQSGANELRFSLPMVDELRGAGAAVEALGAYVYGGRNLSGDDGDPVHLTVAALTPDLYALLGTPPALGRGLQPADGEASGEPVALLDWNLWQTRFGGRPDVLGTSIRLDGRPHQVVGVMPAGFAFPFGEVEVWTAAVGADPRFTWDYENFQPVGRIAAGATSEQARAALESRYRRIERERTGAEPDGGVRVVPLRQALLFLHDLLRVVFLLSLAANGFVLLIVCANLANLLLARAAGRARETAIRTVLGAGRLKLAIQPVAEGALLAVAGGGVGLLLAAWAARALDRVLPEALYRAQPIGVDGRVLAVTLAASVLATLLFALAPALRTTRVDLVSALKSSSSHGGRGVAGQRLQRFLVVSQVLAAFVLLVGTLLMVRTVLTLGDQDLGFEPGGVLTVGLHLPESEYADAAAIGAFEQRLLQRVAELADVRAAALVDPLPLNFAAYSQGFAIEGRAPERENERLSEAIHWVSARYFEAMRLPVIRGRAFAAGDRPGAPPVAIVSRSFAERYWPAAGEFDSVRDGMRDGAFDGVRNGVLDRALGQSLRLDGEDATAPAVTIVGVVADAKSLFAHQPARATLYLPLEQRPRRAPFLVLATRGQPDAAFPAVKDAVHSLDRDLPLYEARAMDAVVAASMLPWRGTAAGLVGMAGLALLLAGLGLYGVLAYVVGTRTAELGVRRALGATGPDIASLVLRQAGKLVAAGVAGGLLLGLALGRLVERLLVGVGALDPLTYVAVTGLVTAAALAAAAAPVLRALRVDPVAALRAD